MPSYRFKIIVKDVYIIFFTKCIPFLLVTNSNFCGTNVSRLIFSKLSPASLSLGNFLTKVMPFVVIANVSRPSIPPNSSVDNIKQKRVRLILFVAKYVWAEYASQRLPVEIMPDNLHIDDTSYPHN